MPNETVRVQSRKEVMTGVWMPVIDQITFSDVPRRGQETQYSYDNSSDNTVRETHIVTIPASNGTAMLNVERIDTYKTKDTVERGQESVETLDNSDPPPALYAGGLPSHWGVQYIRYCKDNDPNSDTWVDVEQITVLHDKDDVSRGQQSYYTLTGWPSATSPIGGDPYNPSFAECDMTLPISSSGLDPVRLDPWQNIVDCSSGGVTVSWTFPFLADDAAVVPGGSCSPVTTSGATDKLVRNWLNSLTVGTPVFGPDHLPAGFSISGTPTISPSSQSFDVDTVFGASFGKLPGETGGPDYPSFQSFVAMSATPILYSYPISNPAPGGACFDIGLGPSLGLKAVGTIDTYSSVGEFTADGSGVTCTHDGVSVPWKRTEITAHALFIVVQITFSN